MHRVSGFAESDGERIYWEDVGAGEPALVFCHGAGGNHVSWFQQVPVFGRERRVITWDHRGFGRSTAHGGATRPELAARDLAAVLRAAGIERPVDVVGQSMGGWTALAFALAQPSRTRRLVLASSPGGIVTSQLAAYRQQLSGNPLEASEELGTHPALGSQLARRDLARAYLYTLLGGFGEPDLSVVLPALAQSLVPDEELRALRCPALFVVGDGDRIFPPDVIRASAEKVEAAKCVEIPGAGHSPYFEQPDTWNGIVSAFLTAA